MNMALDDDPVALFHAWFSAAKRGLDTDGAMALATVGADGQPSLRIVGCRGLEADGSVIFYTSYRSRKARELDAHPLAAATFHFAEQGHQVRLEGTTQRVSAELSDAYFARRPRESQLSAWASSQSQPIISDVARPGEHPLEQYRDEVSRRFEGMEVPRPQWWGGYRLRPHAMELWVHDRRRLHDRVRFTRTENGWQGERLGP